MQNKTFPLFVIIKNSKPLVPTSHNNPPTSSLGLRPRYTQNCASTVKSKINVPALPNIQLRFTSIYLVYPSLHSPVPHPLKAPSLIPFSPPNTTGTTDAIILESRKEGRRSGARRLISKNTRHIRDIAQTRKQEKQSRKPLDGFPACVEEDLWEAREEVEEGAEVAEDLAPEGES